MSCCCHSRGWIEADPECVGRLKLQALMVFLWKMSLFNDFERLSHRLGPVRALSHQGPSPLDWLEDLWPFCLGKTADQTGIKGRRRGSTPNVPLHLEHLLWRDGRPRSPL